MMATTIVSRPIRQLPVELANQIAAGEVVERPASVVKELLENSVDAGATRIEISISRGGLQEIIIRDNGSGIPKAELPLAISRHATSKITNLDELENIHSLGFRGEALASIGSVSHLQLLSCCVDKTEAWQIDCTSDDLSVQAASHPVGTSIIVQDLFYNTPARRKFMRTDKTEFRCVDEVVRRMALSNFNIGFSFKHNGRLVYQLAPAETATTQNQRVAKLCGKAFVEHAVQLDFSAHGLRLWGWITGPEFSRSQNDLQHFYVNGRIVRDRLISHAIRQFYQQWLHPGRHAAYLLRLEIAASSVDVNVHPTKHEVRFREARMVHDFIHRSMCDALPGESASASTVTTHWQPDWRPQTYTSAGYSPTRLAEPAACQDYPLGQAKGLVLEHFVIAESQQGLVLVDARQAQQKILLQKLSQALEANGIQSRPLLIPISISVTASQASMVEQSQAILTQLGFDLSCNGPASVMLRMIPVPLAGADMECLVRSLLEKDIANEARGDLLQLIARSTAATQTLQDSVDDLNRLLREVESLNDAGLWRCLTAQECQSLIKTQQASSST